MINLGHFWNLRFHKKVLENSLKFISQVRHTKILTKDAYCFDSKVNFKREFGSSSKYDNYENHNNEVS